MKKFYLNCWVPSLKNYYKVEELKMYQLEILTKYILNEDNENINSYFNDILKENIADVTIFNKLTKFDKWFVLLFLRASSISSMLHYQARDLQNNNCAISFNLFDMLTDLSELEIPNIPSLNLDDIIVDFVVSKELHVGDEAFDHIFKLTANSRSFYPQTFAQAKKTRLFNTLSKTVSDDIAAHLTHYKDNFNHIFLIKNEKDLKDFYSVKFNILDNTLYGFLKSTFIPYAQEFYKKKYLLLTKLGIDNQSLSNLTPFECDIYINHFNGEKEQITKY